MQQRSSTSHIDYFSFGLSSSFATCCITLQSSDADSVNYYLEILRKSGSEEELKVRGDEPKDCEGDEGLEVRHQSGGHQRGAALETGL